LRQINALLRLNKSAKALEGKWYTLKDVYDLCAGKGPLMRPEAIEKGINDVASACKAYEQEHSKGPQHFKDHTPEE
jgi:hypothetical protein